MASQRGRKAALILLASMTAAFAAGEGRAVDLPVEVRAVEQLLRLQKALTEKNAAPADAPQGQKTAAPPAAKAAAGAHPGVPAVPASKTATPQQRKAPVKKTSAPPERAPSAAAAESAEPAAAAAPAGNPDFGAGKPDRLRSSAPAPRLDKYEVTQKEFQQAMGFDPAGDLASNHPNLPVRGVTWFEARAYCAQAGKRLPAAAEWERAARAGGGSKYYWGGAETAADIYEWHGGNAGDMPHPVGQKQPNAWGLHDMLGNAAEWTEDWSGAAADNQRVIAGGAWHTAAADLDTGQRRNAPPDARLPDTGFRCAQ